MNTVIITGAGISSRFNEGVSEDEKRLKVIYYDRNEKDTLLNHMLEKCSSYADAIVVVGGYKYDELVAYLDTVVRPELREKVHITYNEHYEDLASGYSLHVGLAEAFKIFDNHEKHVLDNDSHEILFVEGDLDVDADSFERVILSDGDVLTCNGCPIESDKSVILYRNAEKKYKYSFSTEHGLAHIDEPFSVILNSGQIWKFADMKALAGADEEFERDCPGGTNLEIIQRYLAQVDNEKVSVERLFMWTNCNTRQDYEEIRYGWSAVMER